MQVKARKQGNSLTLTIPRSFHVVEGTLMTATQEGNKLIYEAVAKENDSFFDFDDLILSDILSEDVEKSEILKEFRKRKSAIGPAIDKMIVAESKNAVRLSREEFEREVGL